MLKLSSEMSTEYQYKVYLFKAPTIKKTVIYLKFKNFK